MRTVLALLHGHDDDPGRVAADGHTVAGLLAEGPAPEVLVPVGPVVTSGDRRAWWENEDGAVAPGALRAGLEHLSGELTAATDPGDRIVLVGFSQGGAAALAHLLTGGPPAPLAVAAVAGWIPHDDDVDLSPAGAARTMAAAGPVPVYLGVGADDEVVPPPASRSAGRLLERLGAPVTMEQLDVGHELGPFLPGLAAWVAGVLG